MWKDLTLQQKAEIMKMSVANGVTDINDIQQLYDGSVGHRFDDAGRIITLADLPIEYVKKYGHVNVVTPKGVRMSLSQAYRDYNQTPINVNDVPGLTDYLIKQDNPDIQEQAHLDKIAADREVKKMNSMPNIGKHLVPLVSPALGAITEIPELQYLASRAIMESGRTFAEPTFGDIEVTRASGTINEPDESAAQATYLLPRDEQKRKFLEFGYMEGKEGDYGLVKNAVGNRNIPVYQTLKDAVDRKDLSVLFNNYELRKATAGETTLDPFIIGTRLPDGPPLLHAGSYPTAYYVDKEGKLYTKSWDLNDYGDNKNRIKGGTGSHYKGVRRLLANTLDEIGSPTVITTGFQPLIDPSINKSSSQLKLDDLMNWLDEDAVKYVENKVGAHWHPRETILENGKLEFIDGSFGGPEVVVTNKKASGGHLFDKGGPKKPTLGLIDRALIEGGAEGIYETTSRGRKPGQAGNKGNKSAHTKTLSDGSSAAQDIKPAKGHTWNELFAVMTSPKMQRALSKYGFDVLNETSAAMMAMTDATGEHLHVGKGIKGQQGKGQMFGGTTYGGYSVNPATGKISRTYTPSQSSSSDEILAVKPSGDQGSPWIKFMADINTPGVISTSTKPSDIASIVATPSTDITDFSSISQEPDLAQVDSQLPYDDSYNESIVNNPLWSAPYDLFEEDNILANGGHLLKIGELYDIKSKRDNTANVKTR